MAGNHTYKQTTMQNTHTPSPPYSNSTPVSNNTPVPVIADENSKTPSENHDQSPCLQIPSPNQRLNNMMGYQKIARKTSKPFYF